MVEPDNELSSNLKYWTIVSVSGEKLVVKLEFESPEKVSQNDFSD